ncbi:MAG: M48 family metallopeptidase [Candidatus Shapirobacteria bacterium]|nr:M48 family metallopeptidase [Candidatus Shapirobacteria bacterium]
MKSIYDQINENKIRSATIISLFIAFIFGVSYFITIAFNLNNSLLFVAIAFSLISSLVGYFKGDQIVLALNKARPVRREEFFNFYTIVENLSIANQTPAPKIYVIDSESPNAFASGRDPKHAIICATTGLLKKLNRTELEGVIAHELSHIKNYDIRLMTLVSILVGTLTILINTATRSTFFRRDNNNDHKNNGILTLIGFILIIFSPLIAQIIQLAISRRREYFADASAIKLTRQPQGLIDALTKISQDDSVFETASTATASLYISNPFKGNKLTNMFSTHPPIEDRIKVLQEMI